MAGSQPPRRVVVCAHHLPGRGGDAGDGRLVPDQLLPQLQHRLGGGRQRQHRAQARPWMMETQDVVILHHSLPAVPAAAVRLWAGLGGLLTGQDVVGGRAGGDAAEERQLLCIVTTRSQAALSP